MTFARLGNGRHGIGLLLILLAAACPRPDKQETEARDSSHDTQPDSTPDDSDTDDSDTAPPVERLTASILGPSKPYDECEEVCFQVQVAWDGLPLAGAIVDIELRGYGFVGVDLVSSSKGLVETCVVGLPVGVSEYAVLVYAPETETRYATTLGEVEIRPFGYMLGFDRSTETPRLPWTPVFSKYAENPVLQAPNPGEDDAERPMLPTVVEADGNYAMWYAFNTLTTSHYTLSTARSEDGIAWVNEGVVPDISSGAEGSWKAFATNSPLLLRHEGTWMLYYTGAAATSSDLSIGLATSTRYEELHGGAGSYRNVADIEGDPVFSWTEGEYAWAGQGVAHPAMLWHDGFFHLWYSTGRHRIGYAMSEDGTSWERYCKNPIFEGDASTWDANEVKSAEVVFYDGWYMMNYSGGGESNFQVGWAMSRDGLHWARAEEPVIRPGARGTWEGTSVLGAPMILDEDALLLRTWYSGTGGSTGSAIGYADAVLPSAIP